MRQDVKWTNLSRRQIARHLKQMPPEVCTSLKQNTSGGGYRRRKALKNRAMGSHPDRDAQFQNIARLKREFLDAGKPVISMDTKKKELLGNFYRDGVIDTLEPRVVNDHDFVSKADGWLIPHGIYDLRFNRGYLNLCTSHDTTEFACDSIEHWWCQHGRHHYPHAEELLILCDGGGSNSASKYIFKQDLEALADRLGLRIRIAHYPPYCSKYNPIEHRLFPHVTHACRGVIFSTLEQASHYMQKTTTATGLKVVVHRFEKVYKTGRTYDADFKQTMRIARDNHLPAWNYVAIPKAMQIGKLIAA